jgi:uncharacterized protein with PIN domain
MANKPQSNTVIIQMTQDEIDQLIDRIEVAISTGMALSTSDLRLTLQAIQTLCLVQSQLHNRDATLKKLRGLLEIAVPLPAQDASEQDAQTDEVDEATLERQLAAAARKKAAQKKRARNQKPKTQAPKIKVLHHALKTNQKGELCPECGIGSLAKTEPAVLIRINSYEPYEITKHVNEQLRCNGCSAIFTAPLPEDVRQDGNEKQKYGYSARTRMMLDKVGLGTPYYRNEQMSQFTGLKIPSSTQYDQMSFVARDTEVIYDELVKIAAQGIKFFADDTGHRILKATEKIKPDRRTGKDKLRTGVKSTCVISYHPDRGPIVLYNTEIGHAGEFLDWIFSHRAHDLPPPLVMSDASSQNLVTVTPVIVCLCLAHALRKFKDLIDISVFAKEATQTLAHAWNNQDTATLENMSAAQTLQYHKDKTWPELLEFKQRCELLMVDDDFEQHSALGNTIAYFVKYFEGLTAFCHYEDAPLDNNECEESLKRIILSRKNSYFFQTEKSAGEFSRLLSIVETAKRSGVHLFDYFNALQAEYTQMIQNMDAYLPWNFHQRRT